MPWIARSRLSSAGEGIALPAASDRFLNGCKNLQVAVGFDPQFANQTGWPSRSDG